MQISYPCVCTQILAFLYRVRIYHYQPIMHETSMPADCYYQFEMYIICIQNLILLWLSPVDMPRAQYMPDRTIFFLQFSIACH